MVEYLILLGILAVAFLAAIVSDIQGPPTGFK